MVPLKISHKTREWRHYLLTLFGSVMDSAPGVEGALVTCVSNLHELWTSDSFLICWSDGACFSSLILLWSDGVEGLEVETVGGTAVETSLENIDMSCSSSNRSNSLLLCPKAAAAAAAASLSWHSSTSGASRNAIESLTDLRWELRLADEKSRNSSTHEGWLVLDSMLPMEGALWWGKLGQLEDMVGTLGGNCAIEDG